MKTFDTTKMNKEDLKSKLVELRKELIKLNAQAATGSTPKNPLQINQTKKNIARLMTALTKLEKK